jgi:hypothetical protein
MVQMQTAGLQAMPQLEAGFYFDLISKAITAVYNMKKAKQWPDIPISKCSQLDPAAGPTVRPVDLLTTFKVLSYIYLVIEAVLLN